MTRAPRAPGPDPGASDGEASSSAMVHDVLARRTSGLRRVHDGDDAVGKGSATRTTPPVVGDPEADHSRRPVQLTGDSDATPAGRRVERGGNRVTHREDREIGRPPRLKRNLAPRSEE